MHSRSTVVGQNEQQFLIPQMHDSESVKVKLGVIKTQLHLACHKITVGMSVMKKMFIVWKSCNIIWAVTMLWPSI